MFMTFTTITLWAAVVAVAAYYSLRLNATGRSDLLDRRTLDPSASPLRLGADPPLPGLVDELEPSPPELTSPASMTFSSVKQAAYLLVKAEEAARQERYEAALTNFQRVVQMYPDIRGVQVSIAAAAMYLNQFEIAAEAYEKAAQEGPMTAAMANSLGVACMKLGDLDRAEQSFLNAYRTDPGRATTCQNLATFYLRRGQLTKAAEYMERHLLSRPNDAMATQTYALLLLRMQQWERAAGLLLQIIQKAPEVAPFYLQLAQAQAHLEQREDAIAALTKATRLMDPRQALDRLAQPEFDLLRNEPAFRDLLRGLGAKE
ncbi:MAG: tetratricopeptide repeat protein [Kiritimatiellae bacterium]|nr:tetratricopeptide repeat protein [Kiritimatiellia bacterium]